jgi:hypothetical protein
MTMILRHPTPRDGIVRLVIVNSVAGSVMGIVFAVALVLVDAQGIGGLIRGSDSGLLAFLLLAGGFAITFGSLTAGTAVMLLAGRDGDGPDDGLPGRSAELVPVRARALRTSSSGRLPRQ